MLPPLNAAQGPLMDTGHSMGAAVCALTFLGMPLKSGVLFSLSWAWLDWAPHSQLVASAWLESHPGHPAQQQCFLLLSTAPPAGRSQTLSLHSPSLSEGETRPAPTAADLRNSGNKGVRNQIRLGTLEPKVFGILIASVSTDGGPPKYSPGCCQDYTSVGTSPSRLLVFPGLYLYTLRSLAHHPSSVPDLYIHKSSR